MDGLELSAGYFDDGDEAENDTIGIKYTMGSMTAAYQMTKVDYAATGTTDQDATHVGVSIAVNEDHYQYQLVNNLSSLMVLQKMRKTQVLVHHTQWDQSQCMVVSTNLRTQVDQLQQQMLKLLSLISRLHSNHLIS